MRCHQALTAPVALLCAGAFVGVGLSGAPASAAPVTPAVPVTPAGPVVPAAAMTGTAGMGATAPTAGTAATAGSSTDQPRVKATAGYLIETGNAGPLWQRRPDQSRAVGSIAKVMTALVVVRAGGLDQKITIRKRHRRCVSHGGTHARLRPGETLTARELLSAMLLPSGCDAAHALAAAYGPGVRPFVAKMNLMASRRGMTRTRFANPDGMPQPREALSTSRDVVKLGRVALRNDVVRDIVARPVVRLPATAEHRAHRWWNTNELLGRYPGVIGIKTGYTSAAGGCVLFAAKRETRTLVGVVLNSPIRSRFVMVARILDWAAPGR